ncbi:MAG: CDGSH iron-sulfur domain-containing protein, partial [Thermacetogeniaceae bacterium]
MAFKSEDSKDAAVAPKKPGVKVTVTKNGPYLVSGKLPLKKEIIVSDNEDESVAWREGETYPDQEQYALCRCGKSGSKPFCDGTHEKIRFNGAETATTAPYYKQATAFDGPELVLTYAQKLCAAARFCHPGGGVWQLTQRSDDPGAKKQAVQEACDCP